MEFLVFGHGGTPVLVFPTSRGRFYQWEDFGMLGGPSDWEASQGLRSGLREHLERGWIQLFCVDSVDQQSWYDFDLPATRVLAMQQAYDDYLLREFLPVLRQLNGTDFLTVTGASFGAYHAASFSFRHPEQVRRLLAMSGDFCIRKYLEDFYDLSVYYHNPIDFVANLPASALEPYRKMDIILASGMSDFCLSSTRQLSATLQQLGLHPRLEVWGEDSVHDWPTWKRMAAVYL